MKNFSRALISFAIATLFTACGGGGAGVTPPQRPASSPTPAATPTSVPAISGTSLSVGYQPQSATLPTAPSGLGATFGVQGSNAPGTTLNLILYPALPTGAPTLQSSKRIVKSIGGNPQGQAYITVVASQLVTFLTPPQITFTLPTAPTSGTVFGLAYYDPTQPTLGWQLLPGNTTNTGAAIAFAPLSPTLIFQAGQTYIFALVTSQALASPVPPISGPGILLIAFPNTDMGLNVGYGIVTINGVALPPSIVYVGSAGNEIQVQAQSTTAAKVKVAVYASSNVNVPPIAYADTTANIVAAQTSITTGALKPVLQACSVSLNPAVVTTGTASDVGIVVTPLSMSGVYGSTYVDLNDNAPVLNATVTDPSGQSVITLQPTLTAPGKLHYSGSGIGPASVGVTSGTITAAASLSYTAVLDGFAMENVVTGSGGLVQSQSIGYYDAGASTPLWSSAGPAIFNGQIAIDANGNIWAEIQNGGLTAFKSDGTPLGTVTSITNETLLTFDSNNQLYMATPYNGANLLKIYSLSSGLTPTLVRTITLPAFAVAAAVDKSGTIYIETGSTPSQVPALYAYPSGASSPSSYTFTNVGAPVTDPQGNVYVNLGRAIAQWAVGTQISSPPTRTVATATTSANFTFGSFAVAPSGDGCAIEYNFLGFSQEVTQSISWTPSGATTPVCPQPALNGSSWTIAAPMH